MSFTPKHFEAIERAIAAEKTVLDSDRTVEYRFTDELLKARNEIRVSLTNVAGPRPCEVRLIKD
ncbi:hypothetical protein SAMN05216475_4076 [Pseudomonas synxantha]|uniref:hypothetical protein n=1 Tax=Pseudomonas synxantha TaxID=47883 RepID=UPI00070490E3|nr:hypothetical protein [Pseudomonas synxantha]AZE65496.1 hypothetical protein C4K01_1284 [Pseudomonas synxantha]KRP56528.1 hypothetical protein TU77_03265 [Pseudomonas synxantha]SDU51530.1 hypothetical protein SAMN05216475_4076 [Pseudomonas synxantha]